MKHIVRYLFLLTVVVTVRGQELVKPNIIIFYADDLGWQDTNLNNVGEPVLWETPNMEKLAAAGAKFSQAYSPAPTCAPSRAAMLSGRHPIKTKVTQVSGGVLPGLKKAKAANKLIGPYYPERLDVDEVTIAEALSPAGYVSSHVGKWHVAGANGFPEAIHQGFGFQFTSRGMHQNMGDRWTGYATDAEDDPYRIDADGRPMDSLTEDALAFMEANKSEPFFLYMATWLVHTPIQTRDLALLSYYCEKLGIPVPTEDTDITTGGQTNPYYGAMIGTLDWSLGKVIDYLEATDDPRNPGKKLFETTYIIFSSDNGASEMDGDEIVADNYPLDLGKTSSKEGGIRVPLVITGPGIPVNEFDNVVNGLDFYPTILSLTGTTVADNILDDLDGADLSPLLKGASSIVEDSNGTERTDLFWHYPNADDEKAKSAIRRGNYKLYKKYVDNSYEAYQLYDGGDTFVDINEATNVIDVMPVSIKNEMIASLEAYLTENNAKYPTWNPDYAEADGPLANQDLVPAVTSASYNQDTNVATAIIENTSGKAAIGTATLLYKENGAKEEWLESTLGATINGNVITANVPETATAVVFNMIDENNFLVLSDEVAVVSVTRITLNNSDLEQAFNPTENSSELIGATTINGNGSYLQMRTEGGGDGAKYFVQSPSNNTSVVCDKVTFTVRSQEDDTVTFNVTIGGETQTFNYTSTRTADELQFDFDTPVTFTSTSQAVEVITTALTNSGGLTPRFRIYGITFHVAEFLGVDDVITTQEALNLYPNPVKTVFSLSKEVVSGAIYNLSGVKVYEFNNTYRDIDISNLRSGLYMLKVVNKTRNEKYLKLLKE
ncbi:sulfatase-like hydrolase/transferase [Flavicella sediminum]|uniref:sulfatase-like hydrolase/transferase n=1 Tax=Flavicella sediminum TaxID=2585141 RepID=UPI001124BFFC|nr:sulfatase-like hydrolase/transferase [Flavicella sediminum]